MASPFPSWARWPEARSYSTIIRACAHLSMKTLTGSRSSRTIHIDNVSSTMATCTKGMGWSYKNSDKNICFGYHPKTKARIHRRVTIVSNVMPVVRVAAGTRRTLIQRLRRNSKPGVKSPIATATHTTVQIDVNCTIRRGRSEQCNAATASVSAVAPARVLTSASSARINASSRCTMMRPSTRSAAAFPSVPSKPYKRMASCANEHKRVTLSTWTTVSPRAPQKRTNTARTVSKNAPKITHTVMTSKIAASVSHVILKPDALKHVTALPIRSGFPRSDD